MNNITTPSEEDYSEIMDVWEASVKATHYFLTEGDILFYRSLIKNEYLKAVELYCIKNENNKISGFMGINGDNLEMLFIHPNMRKKGIGKTLLNYATEQLGITKVDVNEQNQQALDFYLYFGFRVEERSELDGTGKPYPILHMSL